MRTTGISAATKTCVQHAEETDLGHGGDLQGRLVGPARSGHVHDYRGAPRLVCNNSRIRSSCDCDVLRQRQSLGKDRLGPINSSVMNAIGIRRHAESKEFSET